MKRVLTAIPLMLGLIGLTAAVVPGASAAVTAAQGQSAKTIKVTQPMHVVGFNAAVAKAHGYTVHTNAQGQQYVTKTGAAAASPDNTEAGPCGNSWVTYEAIGERSESPRYVAVLSSGYVLNPDFGLAVEGNWVIAVADPAGTGNVVSHDPVGSGLTWDYSWDTYHSRTGYSLATVLKGSSYVITNEGWLCGSAGPYASTTLKA